MKFDKKRPTPPKKKIEVSERAHFSRSPCKNSFKIRIAKPIFRVLSLVSTFQNKEHTFQDMHQTRPNFQRINKTGLISRYLHTHQTQHQTNIVTIQHWKTKTYGFSSHLSIPQ